MGALAVVEFVGWIGRVGRIGWISWTRITIIIASSRWSVVRRLVADSVVVVCSSKAKTFRATAAVRAASTARVHGFGVSSNVGEDDSAVLHIVSMDLGQA